MSLFYPTSISTACRHVLVKPFRSLPVAPISLRIEGVPRRVVFVLRVCRVAGLSDRFGGMMSLGQDEVPGGFWGECRHPLCNCRAPVTTNVKLASPGNQGFFIFMSNTRRQTRQQRYAQHQQPDASLSSKFNHPSHQHASQLPFHFSILSPPNIVSSPSHSYPVTPYPYRSSELSESTRKARIVERALI